MAKRLILRAWRVSEADPSGAHVWFDPEREEVRLYELDPQTETGVRKCSEGDDLYEQHELFQVTPVIFDDGLPF